MRKTLTILTALMALSLVYCDDPMGILGELGFGVIEGREQVATAGDDLLEDPVVARVWRDRSTGQAYIGAAPLHAQETVVGVVGAVVCVGEVPIEGEPIVPHARCTATVADGTATFHLTPPNKAGTHRTPIVAEVDGLALTPDTVTAEVVAGAPVSGPGFESSETGMGAVADTLDGNVHHGPEDTWGNEIPWRLTVLSGPAHVPSTDVNDDLSRMLVPDAIEGSGGVRIHAGGATADGTWESFVNAGGLREIQVRFPGR